MPILHRHNEVGYNKQKEEESNDYGKRSEQVDDDSGKGHYNYDEQNDDDEEEDYKESWHRKRCLYNTR
jgi:hypothetical protein